MTPDPDRWPDDPTHDDWLQALDADLPADPRDRFALTDDLFEYDELRDLLQVSRSAWPPGSAMHGWADQLGETMDHNERHQAAWRTWVEPHERDLAAGADLDASVAAARVSLLTSEYQSTEHASHGLETAQQHWLEDEEHRDDGWGMTR